MAWTLYKEIQYALAGIPSANITDMDQHVEITTDADIAAELGSGGGIKFTSADGSTDLSFGLFPQTSLSAGTVVARFKVDLLTAASVGDVIARLYYSSTESTVEDKSGVYASADAFLDMEQDPSGSAPQMFDWKSETNIGTSAGSMTSGDLVSGKLGNGLDFDGNDYIDIAAFSSAAHPVTIMCIFKIPNVTGADSLVYIGASGNEQGLLVNNGAAWALSQSGTNAQATGGTVSNNTWHSIAGVFASTTSREVFLDGASVGTNSTSIAVTSPGNRTAKIADRYTTVAQRATGIIDEVAIYPSGLSAARIAHWHVNRFDSASTFTLSAEQGGGGTTVTPSPVVASWSIPAPTLRKTRTVSPVSATWSTPVPTLLKSRTVEPVAATWATPSPTLAKSITVDPVTAACTVNDTTLTKSTTPIPVVSTFAITTPGLAKSITPAAVVAQWTVTTPTTGNQIVVTPDPITATWSIPSITATKTVHPQPVSTAWQLPAPTLIKTRSVSPVLTTWTTTAPALIKTTSPSTVSTTWTVTALATSKAVRPSPVTVTWAIADPATSHDNPAPTLIRFTNEMFANPAFINESFANPSMVNETFTNPRFANETFTE